MFRGSRVFIFMIFFLLVFTGNSNGENWKDPVTGQQFISIKGGCFQMGQAESEAADLELIKSAFSARANFGDETPRHEVCIEGYYLGEHEVTVGAFRLFAEETGYLTEAERNGGCMVYPIPGYRWKIASRDWRKPGFGKKQKDNEPVVCISHNDAVKYAGWLSAKDGKRKYRLPTEAEWEFAAREGGNGKVYGGSDELGEIGWYVENSPRRPSPVGGKQANLLGIYDLSGNVWEWTGDGYASRYYKTSPKQNPRGVSESPFKVVRGGSWNSFAWHCRAANREYVRPDHRDTGLGFRLAFSESSGD